MTPKKDLILQRAEELFTEDNPFAAKSYNEADRKRAITRYIPQAERLVEREEAAFIQGWTAHENMIKANSGELHRELVRAGYSEGMPPKAEKTTEQKIKGLFDLVSRIAEKEGI